MTLGQNRLHEDAFEQPAALALAAAHPAGVRRRPGTHHSVASYGLNSKHVHFSAVVALNSFRKHGISTRPGQVQSRSWPRYSSTWNFQVLISHLPTHIHTDNLEEANKYWRGETDKVCVFCGKEQDIMYLHVDLQRIDLMKWVATKKQYGRKNPAILYPSIQYPDLYPSWI